MAVLTDGQKLSMGEYQLSFPKPVYVPKRLVDITNALVKRVQDVKEEKNLTELRYIPHWRVNKFRAQRLRIHMMGLNQALVIFPWWRPNFLLPSCAKCGGITYPIHEPFKDKNAFFLCYNESCDFVMHSNYK